MGRWVYGFDHNGDRGKVKGLKNKLLGRGWGPERLRSRITAGDGAGRKLACSLRSGTVLSRKVVGKTAHSPRQ